MKKSKAFSRRVLSVLLAALMICSVGMFTAAADDSITAYPGVDFNGEYPTSFLCEIVDYTTTKKTVRIWGYDTSTFSGGELVIPEKVSVDIGGQEWVFTVIGIGDYAFKNATKITSVRIPATVTSIGKGAFAGCTAIASVTFSGPLTESGVGAFSDTAWYKNYPTDFILGGTGLTFLLGYKGSAASVVIPNTIRTIGSGAFKGNTTITSVTVPSATEFLGDSVFADCTSLKTIDIKGTIEDCGMDVFKNTAWFNSYTGEFLFIGDLMLKYLGKEETVSVPNTFKKIAPNAFTGCTSVFTVILPSTLTSIGEDAFFIYNDGNNAKYAQVYCQKDSYADTYAKTNGLTIAGYTTFFGDVDESSAISAADSRIVLRVVAKLAKATDYQKYLADVNGDGVVNADDARKILRMAAGLEKYDKNSLLTSARTSFEVLMSYSNAVARSDENSAGFTEKEFRDLSKINLNLNTKNYLDPVFGGTLIKNWTGDYWIVPEKYANSETWGAGSKDATNAFPYCSLINYGIIKSATSVVQDDGTTKLTINLNEEKEVAGSKSLYSMIIPSIDDAEFFENKLNDTIWYKYNKFDKEITYKNGKIVAVVGEDGFLDSITMTYSYYIKLSGKICLIPISGAGSNYGDMTVSVTARYTDFNF